MSQISSKFIKASAITNSKLANMAANTVKANVTGSSAAPTDVSVTSTNTSSAVVIRDSSGNFSAGTITAALTGTASGNTTYTANNHGVVLSSSTNTMTVVAPDASTSKVLVSGGSSADPSWALLTNSNLSGSAAITNANLAAMANNTIKANVSGGSSTPSDISLTNLANASSVMYRDANTNTRINNIIEGFTTTATAAGTTTLTVSSTYTQQFTGTTTQTVVLPDATTLVAGQAFMITNRSTGVVTVNANGGGLIQTMAAGSQTIVTVTAVGTSAGSWDSAYSTTSGGSSSPLTTKGDIYTHSTVDARQAVPGDNGMLVPDSTQTTGWRSASYTQFLDGRPGKNYIQYADFENNSTTGWTLGTIGTLTNNLPTGTPTFGSGASGNLSISTVSSSQVAGAYSMSYVSSAATTSGNMVASSSYAIDAADQAKVLTVKFYYSVFSGAANCNFSGTSSNSYAWAIWDVTNSSWLTSAGNFNLVQSSGVGYVTGTVQTNATTANIRLCVYNANATSGAATLYLDDFYVGPQTAPSGPCLSDWTTYTPTLSGVGTATNVSFGYRRVGDTMQVRGSFTAGTATGTYSVSLPSGLTIDTNKIRSIGGGGVGAYVNGVSMNNTGAGTAQNYFSAGYTGYAFYDGSDTSNIYFSLQTQSSTFVKATFNTIGSNNEGASVVFEVPISGWSSNSVQSSDTDTRVVSFSASKSGGSVTSPNAIASWSVINKDTHGAFNNSTGVYTVPVSGDYYVNYILHTTSGTTTPQIYKNSTQIYSGINNSSASGLSASLLVTGCAAGDTIYISLADNETLSSGTAPYPTILNINRLSGPAVISSNSVVAMMVSGAAASASSGNAIIWPTVGKDTHGAYSTSTGQYTAPVTGYYQVSATMNSSYSAGGQFSAYVAGSVQVPAMGYIYAGGEGSGSTLVYALAGQTIDVRANANSGGAFNSSSGMTIVRVGGTG